MARGRGRGGPKRGGGHTFSRDLVLDEDGIAVSKDKRFLKRKDEDSGDKVEEEEETEEESSDDDAPNASTSAAPGEQTLSRVERKAMKQAAKKKHQESGDEDEDADLINPNRLPQTNAISSDLSAPKELSRREREAKEKKEAADRYKKLHAAGKTVEAKADLARLAMIRKEREAAAAKRKAEQEAKQAELDAKQGASKQKR